MKLKRYKWIAVVAIVVAVVGGWIVWQRNRELRYEGKTIRQWIAVAKGSQRTGTNSLASFTTIRSHKEVLRMLDALGTNAASPLIQILDDGDSMVTSIKATIAASKWAPASIKSAASAGLTDSLETLSMTGQAISYLGSNAVHLIPELERIICDGKKPLAAYIANGTMGSLGVQALPALRRSLTNAPASRRQLVQVPIQRIYREAMKSENARDREDAALALIEYPRPPFQIIQIFLDMLKDPDPRRQNQSLNALAVHLPTMAPSLIAGYRAVEKLTNSEDAEVRRAATELLRKLPEPDPSKKP